MTTVFDVDDALVNELRTYVSAFGRALCKRGDDVDLRECFGGAQKVVGAFGDPIEQRLVERAFEPFLPALRGRNREFEFLELGRNVPLAGRQRLFANVVTWHRRGMRFAHLDRIAEGARVLDLQRFDAGAL